MQDRGRRRVLEALGDKATATQVEAVAPPDFDPVAAQPARAGCKLIFTTSFGFFQPTLRMAEQRPR